MMPYYQIVLDGQVLDAPIAARDEKDAIELWTRNSHFVAVECDKEGDEI